jgi:lipopolysaccharide export system permease protein
MMAEEGVLVQGEDGPIFVLENGNRQELDRRNGEQAELSVLHFDSYTLDLAAATTPAGERDRRPKELFLDDLFFPDDALDEQQRQRLITEGHKRVTWPLNALVFAVIGMTALLVRRHDRQGPWRGMLLAVVSVLAVQALSTASSSLALREPSLTPLLYLVPIAPIVICGVMLVRRRPRHAVPDGLRLKPI